MTTALKERYLKKQVQSDLKDKMVFLGGPRQVGKTTLAKSLLKKNAGYYNWDVDAHRSLILENQLSHDKLWVFDEIHKFKRWRNWLKGIYDSKTDDQEILVTGSARLDLYRYGGDSLQGRYQFLRLHPLSVAELQIKNQSDFMDLLRLGGFPEPFFKGSEAFARRWSLAYRTRLIRDEIPSLERIDEISLIELLANRLPALVGSPLSINALREDLQVSHKSVKSWLAIMGRLYHLFMVSPFGAPKVRAVKKEQKHYHFDWTLCSEPGSRFENLVACHLLKWADYQYDVEGYDIQLRYFRDRDGREVDFVLVKDEKPILLVECKSSGSEISPHLRYLKQKFPKVRAVQVAADVKNEFKTKEGIELLSAHRFLAEFV